MSELRTDVLKDGAGTGSPSFPNGLAKADIAGALNATGEAPIFGCRAWVNFNGTRNVDDTGASTNGEPVLIRASGNVTSVVKNGVGDYTVNFTTAMPDASYVLFGATSGRALGDTRRTICLRGTDAGGASEKTAALVRVEVGGSSAVDLNDMAEINVTIFR